jgi:hypothetical protein
MAKQSYLDNARHVLIDQTWGWGFGGSDIRAGRSYGSLGRLQLATRTHILGNPVANRNHRFSVTPYIGGNVFFPCKVRRPRATKRHHLRNHTMKNTILALLACLTVCNTATGQVCRKQSPAHTVALLELYTSEGCSSCPPADRALAGLKSAAQNDQVVPLALHVDYWDYIGWTDRFAKPEFTARQSQLVAEVNSRAIYTPELFLGTRELRSWHGQLDSAIGAVNQAPARASIVIEAGKPSGGKLAVSVKTTAAENATLYLALYENGLSSNIKAGENNGVVLHHDFVVRDWLGPIALPAKAGDTVNVRQLTLPAGAGTELGVAAFVRNGKGEVLQALALPLALPICRG